jgi:thioredoxin 1
MKVIRLCLLFLFFMGTQTRLFAQAVPQRPRTQATSEHASAFAFEPLDQWKAAVLAGDKVAIAKFYSTNPPTRVKTSEGETQDPNAEPVFWSGLRSAGLNRLDVKVLEAKTLQPGVMSLVLRFEAGLRNGAGEKQGLVSGVQIWVQKLGVWQIVATQRSGLMQKPAMRLPEPARPNVQLYPDPQQVSADIASALAASSKDHKRVLLVFGGNWCYDCHVLDATFHSKAVAPLVNENYHVVHVNVGDYNANLDLAKKYEIPLEKGVPSLAILDPDGRLVVSQKKGEFESTERIGPEDIVEFLKKWKPQRGT